METIISYEQLLVFTKEVFTLIGCSENDARTAANVLVSADLRGVDSHGVARLSGYVRLWKAGRVNATPNMKIVHETLSTAVVDADAALGLVSAPFAMEIAMQKAQTAGTGWVCVQNSNHFGIAGYHAMMALNQDMIGIAMTNASALVAPTYSKERMLGTNPIAMAVPALTEPPYVADFATAAAANGKLEIAQRKKEDIPEGWAQTLDGESSTDASILKNNGALLPLGSDKAHGSHKGYCLGSMVDILTGVLSGASYGPWAPPFPAYVPMPTNMPGKGLGHFLGAMRIDAFQPAINFKGQMDRWIKRFRSATPIGEETVQVPGDQERVLETIRRKEGIPIQEEVIKDLTNLTQMLKMSNNLFSDTSF
ncbi:MAG: malate dehydrogenase [Pseudopedobacter saltans]|uniref:Malate dehydrogenase n=1 Tax=Pseudopedobacter saltans TaxID=151895 RepID=A0A2W5H8K2_9SPHI|nr:MAG: malate dehydrogenase [Pseudopedobacter saltans]